jgi:hypothetical protein
MEPEGSLPCSQEPFTSPYPEPDQSNIHFLSLKSFIQGIRPGPRLLVVFRNKLIFYGEEELAPRPTPQAGGPPHVGCPRLLIQYIRSYPPKLEGVSSLRNLRTRHAVVTRDPPDIVPSIIHFGKFHRQHQCSLLLVWGHSVLLVCTVHSVLYCTEPLPSNESRDTHTDTQTNGRNLWSTPLRCAQVPWYTYQVSQRLFQAFKS